MKYRRNADDDIRSLERRYLADPHDPETRTAYRSALIRTGQGNDAGLMVGDTVRVIEVPYATGSSRGVSISPMIKGTWVGVINAMIPKNEVELDTSGWIVPDEPFQRMGLEEIRVIPTEFIGKAHWNDDEWISLATAKQNGVPLVVGTDHITLVSPA